MKHIHAVLSIVAIPASLSHAQNVVEAKTPGFTVSFGQDAWIRVWYRGIPVVVGSNFTISKPGWKGSTFPNLKPGTRSIYKAQMVRERARRTITLTGAIKGAAKNRIVIEVEPNTVRIRNAYEIKASPDVGYVYTECFLSKELLNRAKYVDDAGQEGTLKIEDGGAAMSQKLGRVRIDTRFGALSVTASQEHQVTGELKRVPWGWRNVCNREWGAEERRTFSICNVAGIERPAAIAGHSEYEIRFEPNAAFDEEMAKRRSAQEAARQQLAGDRQAKLTARAERIAKRNGVVIAPQPQEMQVREGEFVVGPETQIVVGHRATEEDRRSADRLAEELRDYFRIDVTVARVLSRTKPTPLIVIGRPAANDRLASLLKHRGLSVDAKSPGPEGYLLDVQTHEIALAGSDEAGTWYGVQTLLQMTRWQEGKLTVPCATIRDWPEFKVRAMMLTLGSRKQLGFLKHTLRRVLPRMKLNMVFIGGASIGKVKWPSHPEAGYEFAFLPEDIRELADLARANFIEPVPHVQGFGHTGPLKHSHPELLVSGGRSRQPAFDIRKDAARQFVYDIYADAIAAFRPKRHFHVGFDEAQDLNLICRGDEAADLVTHHITEVSNWLDKRGLRMIMWADMLLDYERFSASSAAHSMMAHYGNVNTASAIDRIPKSIMLANWYYRDAEEHPQIEFLQKKGFHVFPTTWWQDANNCNFLRSAKKAGLTWASGSSWMYCSATNPAMMNMLLGEYAWTPNRPTLDALDYEPLGKLAEWMKGPRVSDVPCDQTPIDLRTAMNRSYVDDVPGDDRGWLDMGAEKDLSALEAGRQRMGRYLFDVQPAAGDKGCVLLRGARMPLEGVPSSASVELGKACDALVFLHALHHLQYGPRTAGQYVVTYEDGRTEAIDLRHTINIGPWLRRWKSGWWKHERTRGHYWHTERAWVGYTLAGDEVCLLAHEWTNPRSDVPLKSIEAKLTDNSPDLALGLFAITALTRK